MLMDVSLLRRDGMRLRPAELAEPVRGHLALGWMTESSFGRPVQTADLYDRPHHPGRRALLLTLLDVRLVALGDGSLSLAGIELSQIDGRVIERGQVWRCVPVTGCPPSL